MYRLLVTKSQDNIMFRVLSKTSRDVLDSSPVPIGCTRDWLLGESSWVKSNPNSIVYCEATEFEPNSETTDEIFLLKGEMMLSRDTRYSVIDRHVGVEWGSGLCYFINVRIDSGDLEFPVIHDTNDIDKVHHHILVDRRTYGYGTIAVIVQDDEKGTDGCKIIADADVFETMEMNRGEIIREAFPITSKILELAPVIEIISDTGLKPNTAYSMMASVTVEGKISEKSQRIFFESSAGQLPVREVKTFTGNYVLRLLTNGLFPGDVVKIRGSFIPYPSKILWSATVNNA